VPVFRTISYGASVMIYPGGKNGAGIFQRIINHMPPHRTYVEAFLGSGAVLRNKRPAHRNVGIDRSVEALDLCLELADQGHVDHSEFRLLDGDALKLLPSLKSMVDDSYLVDQPETLIYADPPYMMETRKGADIYDFEMDDEAHARLMDIVTKVRCMVMISGYRSPLYDDALSHFTRIDYQAQTRRGPVTESLWMNFKPPVALHDYRHLGADYRERERIKRKKVRWAAKIAKMDRQERLAIMEVLTREVQP
jgi:16S rRNA G966 N2-methylase RsmD